MTRIKTIESIDTAPDAAQPLLHAAAKKIDSVPNLFRVVANSPAALEGYLRLSASLGKGSLDTKMRERIALAVAEIHSCGYCLAAHTFIGRNAAKMDDAEITANRNGASNDPKADAAVRFAAKIVETRGQVSDTDVVAVKAAGFDDAAIIEILMHVALNTFTNYVNDVAQTEIDFPLITPRKAA